MGSLGGTVCSHTNEGHMYVGFGSELRYTENTIMYIHDQYLDECPMTVIDGNCMPATRCLCMLIVSDRSAGNCMWRTFTSGHTQVQWMDELHNVGMCRPTTKQRRLNTT